MEFYDVHSEKESGFDNSLGQSISEKESGVDKNSLHT